MFAQRRRRWPNIVSQLDRCIVLFGWWVFRGIKRHPHGSQSKHGTITQFCFNVGSASKTGSILKQHWVNVMCLLMWRKVYRRPSVGLVLGLRRRRMTGIEPAMGCDVKNSRRLKPGLGISVTPFLVFFIKTGRTNYLFHSASSRIFISLS